MDSTQSEVPKTIQEVLTLLNLTAISPQPIFTLQFNHINYISTALTCSQLSGFSLETGHLDDDRTFSIAPPAPRLIWDEQCFHW